MAIDKPIPGASAPTDASPRLSQEAYNNYGYYGRNQHDRYNTYCGSNENPPAPTARVISPASAAEDIYRNVGIDAFNAAANGDGKLTFDELDIFKTEVQSGLVPSAVGTEQELQALNDLELVFDEMKHSSVFQRMVGEQDHITWRDIEHAAGESENDQKFLGLF